MKNVFETTRWVTAKEIDDLNHVNNVVYIKWMDEIAFEHWAMLTKNNPLPEFVWVVVRHEIDYVRQAMLGDKITVKTWVGKSKSYKSERFMEFYLGNKLLVKAITIWGMLDAKTYKPARITENILKVLEPLK